LPSSLTPRRSTNQTWRQGTGSFFEHSHNQPFFFDLDDAATYFVFQRVTSKALENDSPRQRDWSKLDSVKKEVI
jgi:hypothetical protein